MKTSARIPFAATASDEAAGTTLGRRHFLAGATALAGASALGTLKPAQAQGVGYQTLAKPVATRDPSKVEVLEFFWFGCPHCFRFEPTINRWKESKPEYVNFVREAPPFNPGWENHSRTFYAAEALGITDGMFDPMFNEIHVNRKAMRSADAVAEFIEELDLGVDAETFEKAMTSFSVETGMRRGLALAQDAQVSGVPAVLINGKFMTSASLAGGNDGMIRVINQLAEQENKAS